MKVLTKDELQISEGFLRKYFPKSLRVYGFLCGINRKKLSTLEVIVDTWPDLTPSMYTIELACYSMDEQILRKMLTEENAVDWSTYFAVGGFDSFHDPLLKELSSERKVNNRWVGTCHLLYLPDTNHLLTPAVDSERESRISSLNLSHVDLVNKTWKYGGNEKGDREITHYISNFPSCCITDGQGQLVSWILMYDSSALGMLYTLPEHRGRGYAKVLVSTMAKRLHAEGYPVYCFIDEGNEASYKLFKNLGFIEDPSYRASWFAFNY